MNLFYLSTILNSSILIGGAIALIRFGDIRKEYHPFIFLIWLGCVNETVSYISAVTQGTNVINSIIYDLCESLFLLWFFRNIQLFKRNRALFFGLIVLFVGLWVVESFFSKQFGSQFNSYFTITYSCSIVLLSITAINKLLFEEREVVRNPTFLICMGMVIFFTYKIVVEMFWLYGLRESRSFRINVLIILMCVNFLCNLIYALAILWMRKKRAFTLQF